VKQSVCVVIDVIKLELGEIGNLWSVSEVIN